MFRDRYLCQIQLIHTGRVAQVENLRDVDKMRWWDDDVQDYKWSEEEINSQSLEDTQVGYISQKYTLEKFTLEKYT